MTRYHGLEFLRDAASVYMKQSGEAYEDGDKDGGRYLTVIAALYQCACAIGATVVACQTGTDPIFEDRSDAEESRH